MCLNLELWQRHPISETRPTPFFWFELIRTNLGDNIIYQSAYVLMIVDIDVMMRKFFGFNNIHAFTDISPLSSAIEALRQVWTRT